MQRHNKKRHVAIIGESGSGKTTLAARFLTNSRFGYNFIFDEEEQFAEILGIPVCRTPQEIERSIATGWTLFEPSEMFPGESEQGLDFFADYVFQVCGKLPGQKSFTLDESGSFQESHFVPKPLKIILQKGRRHGITGLFLSHQPNELHNKIRVQLTEVICFQMKDDGGTLDFLKSFGFNVEELENLPEFRWIGRNKRGQQFKG
ncbi:MAG: hypothetical protein ACXWC8_00320 [Limisphaerales bacterium]